MTTFLEVVGIRMIDEMRDGIRRKEKTLTHVSLKFMTKVSKILTQFCSQRRRVLIMNRLITAY